jgi:hypothetical protein
MSRIVIPYLQIGESRVETPVGLSELLEPAWSKPNGKNKVKEFASNFTRTTFRNSEGKWVTKYKMNAK